MAIQLSYNGTLYSYDNKTSAVVNQSGNIEVEIHPYESIEGATLYYQQGDTEGAVTISDNKANIPGIFLLTGSLSIGLKFPSSISNFVSIDVTRISSGGELLDDDIQFTLDNKKRLVLVPDSQALLAIQYDNQSEAITFKFPRYQDSVDLSTKTPCVNYKRPVSEDLGKSICNITSVEDDYIQFVWVIGSLETEHTGTIQFQVEFTDFQEYRWQSQIAELPVLVSLYNTGLESYNPGILEEYIQQINSALNSVTTMYNEITQIGGRVASSEQNVMNWTQSAEQAKRDAEAANQAIQNMTVSANTVDENTQAGVTKSIDNSTGVVNLTFDIPQGKTGNTGSKGDTGNGIESIERTDGDGSPGTSDTYTIQFTDGDTYQFQVYNGVDGSGAVLSVNGKTGDVKLTANDIEGFSKVATTGEYKDLTETPQALKNPQALTFIGGSDVVYDGSDAKTVSIPLIQRGSWSISNAAGAAVSSTSVVFPKEFPGNPTISATIFTSGPNIVTNVTISNVSPTGFTVNIYRTSAGDTVGHWIAVY